MRDLLDGKTRFSEFERSPEGIPTNILTDRLCRLEGTGLAERVRARPRHDSSTTRLRQAATSAPVLLALAAWGNQHLDETWVPPPDHLAPPA